jgi:hypothetical protein
VQSPISRSPPSNGWTFHHIGLRSISRHWIPRPLHILRRRPSKSFNGKVFGPPVSSGRGNVKKYSNSFRNSNQGRRLRESLSDPICQTYMSSSQYSLYKGQNLHRNFDLLSLNIEQCNCSRTSPGFTAHMRFFVVSSWTTDN